MNQLAIQQAPQLPAHLANFADLSFGLNESITGGLSKGGGHPSIGIKQSRWRIREGAHEEVVQSFTLNVIVVNANKSLSKIFYAGKYDPNADKLAPDCFSDNGIGPSTQAQSPQCTTCAMCPNNVWGSKITDLGTKTKACADYKKLAVILADDPNRDVYELRVPGASLQGLNEIMTKLSKSGVPIPAVVFELSFDPAAQFPKIVFKPLGYVSEEQAAAITDWVNSDEAKQAVGENDVPIQHSNPSQSLPPVAAKLAALAHTKTPAQNNTTETTATPFAFLEQPQGQTQEAPQALKGRGRPKGSVKAQAPSQGFNMASEPVQMDLPGMQSPAAATPINPAKTDASLDALLAGIL